MSSPVSLRLDDETRRSVARIARRKGTTPSTILREVIKTWVKQEEELETPYHALRDLIGVVHGNDPRRSENGGSRVDKAFRDH